MVKFILTIALLFIFGYIAMYNKKLLGILDVVVQKLGVGYSNQFGQKVRRANQKITRTATLNKKSMSFKIYDKIDTIIVNLEMAEDGVTVMGFIIYVIMTSIAGSLAVSILFGTLSLILPTIVILIYLLMTIFQFRSIMRYEKREADVMDSVDLLVSDVADGVQNAIVKYQESFPVDVRPYFMDFLDDVQRQGYSFEVAILRLNDKLGINFTEFAQKAILYENKGDAGMEDIFASILEANRTRRLLRYINNIRFANIRTQFLVSALLIAGYALFASVQDPFILQFLTKASMGRFMILADVVIVAGVLSYIARLKATTL